MKFQVDDEVISDRISPTEVLIVKEFDGKYYICTPIFARANELLLLEEEMRMATTKGRV